MLVRVLEKIRDEDTFTIETPQVPSVGDSFLWQTNGPYKVIERIWHLPAGYQNDRPEIATLIVEKIKPSSGGGFQTL